jgi:alanine dehydrogenase
MQIGVLKETAPRERRVALAPDALLEGRKANDLLAEIVDAVAAPRM